MVSRRGIVRACTRGESANAAEAKNVGSAPRSLTLGEALQTRRSVRSYDRAAGFFLEELIDGKN